MLYKLPIIYYNGSVLILAVPYESVEIYIYIHSIDIKHERSVKSLDGPTIRNHPLENSSPIEPQRGRGVSIPISCHVYHITSLS